MKHFESEQSMAERSKSVLVVTADPALSQCVAQALARVPGTHMEEHGAYFAQMNGTARTAALQHDIVIFDVDPGNPGEMKALNEILKTPHQGTRFIALTSAELPLAKAQELTRAGIDVVLPFTGSSEEIAEAIRARLLPPLDLGAAEAAARPAPAAAQEKAPQATTRGRLIAVSTARGGLGGTSVAVNLAWELLDRHGLIKKTPRKRVAVVDLDLQFGNVGVFLDIEDRGGMLEIARSATAPDAEFLRAALVEHPSGLHVLTAPVQAAPLDALNERKVASLLDALLAEHDFVVVDMPRVLVQWLDPVLARADSLLMVTDLAVPSVRQARRLIDLLTEDHPALPVEIVVYREKRPLIQQQHHKDAAAALGRPLAHWLPDDPKAARLAIDRGQPVAEVASGSGLAKGLARLARELREKLAATARSADAKGVR